MIRTCSEQLSSSWKSVAEQANSVRSTQEIQAAILLSYQMNFRVLRLDRVSPHAQFSYRRTGCGGLLEAHPFDLSLALLLLT